MTTNLEAAFAAAVTGAALVYPPLALIVAALFWVGIEIWSEYRLRHPAKVTE
jgi:hypothetical protein